MTSSNTYLAIIDDDFVFRKLWQLNIQDAKVVTFESPSAFEAWFATHAFEDEDQLIVVTDNYFGDRSEGLSLASALARAGVDVFIQSSIGIPDDQIPLNCKFLSKDSVITTVKDLHTVAIRSGE